MNVNTDKNPNEQEPKKMTNLLIALATRIAEAQAVRQAENERLNSAFAASCRWAEQERAQASAALRDEAAVVTLPDTLVPER